MSILDRCDIDTMDASEDAETLLRYLQHKQALVITNYIEKMPGSDGWADARWKWTRSNLTKLYGNVDLDIGFKLPRMPLSTTVKDYLKYTTRCMKHKFGGAKVQSFTTSRMDSPRSAPGRRLASTSRCRRTLSSCCLRRLQDHSYPHPTSANASEHHYRHTFILRLHVVEHTCMSMAML